LHSVIGQADAQGPLILAGHSLGGLITRVYTREHLGQVAGLVQVDATPEAIAGDPGVKVGFLASGMMASILKALAPFGFVRFLLTLGKTPLYPEQGLFRAQVTDEDYRYWTAAVCRDFTGAADSELRSVLPAAVEAQRRRVGVAAPELGDLPLGVLTSLAWGQKWVDMHRELATRSRSSFHRITGDRSHNIHMRHAALVVDAIRDVAAARRQDHLGQCT
jgi:pimeloyl-ACP methyl ester carboxylesterase